jgi:hypothetical protein
VVVAVKVDPQAVLGVKSPGLLADEVVEFRSQTATELWFAVALPLHRHT